MSIIVTQAAENHFRELLKQQKDETLNIRIHVANPSTIHADVALTFCAASEKTPEDTLLNFEGFSIYVDQDSLPALKEASIDLQVQDTELELLIKAPYLKGNKPKDDSPLREKVQYVLDSEVNPNLAGHKGSVKLVDILDEQIVVLQFGGGCHGCGMANVTLKHGIEKTLKEKFPEILEVRDITDHTLGENPYYAGQCETI